MIYHSKQQFCSDKELKVDRVQSRDGNRAVHRAVHSVGSVLQASGFLRETSAIQMFSIFFNPPAMGFGSIRVW